jgi:hypothetical protein
MRVTSDGSMLSPVDEKLSMQREAILDLERQLKAILRLRGKLEYVQQLLDSGHVETGKRELGRVLEQWPST